MFSVSLDKWGTKWVKIRFRDTFFNIAWQLYGAKQPWNSPFMETNCQWVIQKAWGKRRVSSRALTGTTAYPESIGAVLGMWFSWWRYNRKMKFDYVVVTGEGADHGALYAAELKKFADEEMAKAVKAAWTPERIADLQAQRVAARAKKDFDLADSLRDQIEAAGVVVNDTALAPFTRKEE